MRNKKKIIAGIAAVSLSLTLATSFAFADDSATSSSGGGVRLGQIKSKIDTAKQKFRAARAEMIDKLAQNQINRAQKALDKLSSILDRIIALEGKLDTTKVSSTDLNNVNDLIDKAKTQKMDTQKAIDDLKTKADALKAAITAAVTNTDTAVTTNTKPVRDFMTSVKTVKTDLIALHSTLKQIVKTMKTWKPKVQANVQNNNQQGENENDN